MMCKQASDRDRDESLGADKIREICARVRQAYYFIRLLEEPYSEYYSRGRLNSEGMTLLMNIIRIIAPYMPREKALLHNCLRDRSYENVIKYLSIIRERLEHICNFSKDFEDREALCTPQRPPSWYLRGEEVHS